MMPYQSYQLWEAERVKSARDWQAADRRAGELAAMLSGLLRRSVRRPAGMSGLCPTRAPGHQGA
jgi:hypothetical protein